MERDSDLWYCGKEKGFGGNIWGVLYTGRPADVGSRTCCRGISVTLVRTSGGRHYPPDILRRLMPPAASWKASQPAVSALARSGLGPVGGADRHQTVIRTQPGSPTGLGSMRGDDLWVFLGRRGHDGQQLERGRVVSEGPAHRLLIEDAQGVPARRRQRVPWPVRRRRPGPDRHRADAAHRGIPVTLAAIKKAAEAD